MLAVLSSMSEDSKDVEALFYTKEINAAGCYLVYFFINGVKQAVILDDYLPTRHGKPCFAHSRDSEVWVCLIEKAWAKLHGSYERAEGGAPYHASVHVAGVPSKSIQHKEHDVNVLQAIIKSCDQRNYTMIAGTFGHGEAVDSQGIVAGHAYSLIS